jgi:hypothetical protein
MGVLTSTVMEGNGASLLHTPDLVQVSASHSHSPLFGLHLSSRCMPVVCGLAPRGKLICKIHCHWVGSLRCCVMVLI